MVNRLRPNKAYVNRQSPSEVFQLEATFNEVLTGFAKYGSDISMRFTLNEMCTLRGKLHLTRYATASWEDELTGTGKMHATISIKENFDEILTIKGVLGSVFTIKENFDEELKSVGILGAIFNINKSFNESLEVKGILGAIFNLESNFEELLEGYGSVYNVSEVWGDIDVDIPPGGELVIDSENYNVFLNNENVIDKYTGDWIFIDRDTQKIEVTGINEEEAEIEVFYNALFL